MTEHVLAVVGDNAPWRSRTPWWLVGLQAVVVFVIGLYLLVAPGTAGSLIIQLVALAVLVQCLLAIVAVFTGTRAAVNPFTMVQAGVGATVGLLVLGRGLLAPTLDLAAAKSILAWGLILYVVIEVAGSLVNRESQSVLLNRAITALLLLVLAVVLLTSSEANATDRLAFLGWTMVVGGLVLGLLAYRAKSRADAAPVAPLAPA